MCGDYNGEYDGVLMNSFGSYFWCFSDSNSSCKVILNIVPYDGVCSDMKIFGITLEDCTDSRVVVV